MFGDELGEGHKETDLKGGLTSVWWAQSDISIESPGPQKIWMAAREQASSRAHIDSCVPRTRYTSQLNPKAMIFEPTIVTKQNRTSSYGPHTRSRNRQLNGKATIEAIACYQRLFTFAAPRPPPAGSAKDRLTSKMVISTHPAVSNVQGYQ